MYNQGNGFTRLLCGRCAVWGPQDCHNRDVLSYSSRESGPPEVTEPFFVLVVAEQFAVFYRCPWIKHSDPSSEEAPWLEGQLSKCSRRTARRTPSGEERQITAVWWEKLRGQDSGRLGADLKPHDAYPQVGQWREIPCEDYINTGAKHVIIHWGHAPG